MEWQSVFSEHDAQQAFSKIQSMIQSAYEESFPLIKFKKRPATCKNWLTDCLKKSIRNKNKLYMWYRKRPTVYNKNKYLMYKRALRKVLNAAEKNYYDLQFERFGNDLKNSWKILKRLIGVQPKLTNNEFSIDGKRETDYDKIANAFNAYFVNIGQSLDCQLPQVSEDEHRIYMKSSNSSSIYLAPATATEVTSILTQMKNSAPGWEGFKAEVLKLVNNEIALPLTHVVNLSLTQGIVPYELKVAKVTPVYKNGNKDEINNYRPISVLPALSKVFERVMHSRVVSFLENNNILNDCQFGYRNGRSTNMALTMLVDKITAALDKKEYFMGIFIDLSKAFDTVNHSILLSKLKHYGIRGVALKWFGDYLDNRKQYVELKGIKSERLSISCGVPQGSILGPLLFLLYINDLPNVSKCLSFIMYADDTNVFMSSNCIRSLESIMNDEINKLVKWMRINRLSLNVKKNAWYAVL